MLLMTTILDTAYLNSSPNQPAISLLYHDGFMDRMPCSLGQWATIPGSWIILYLLNALIEVTPCLFHQHIWDTEPDSLTFSLPLPRSLSPPTQKSSHFLPGITGAPFHHILNSLLQCGLMDLQGHKFWIFTCLYDCKELRN